MSTSKTKPRRDRHRKKRRNAAAQTVVNARRPKRESMSWGKRIISRTKRLFAWDRVRTWQEVRWQVIGGTLAILPLMVWAFWPTLLEVFRAWNSEPDYSHGFLILPIALYFLWARRDRFCGWSQGPLWAGLMLIVCSLAIRWLGARFFLGSVDAWGLVVGIAGATWVICGTRVFWYGLPSLTFLFMGVPLPYRIERGLSLKLQDVATNLSTWTLQIAGRPALAEGHTILLGDTQLEVEQACSGMRIFMGIFAIAFAYIVVRKRTWWETALITAAVIPIALAANITRIVSTGLLYEFVSGEAAKHFSHDLAGLVMIPLAAIMFAMLLWYLKIALPEVEIVNAKRIIKAAKK